MSYNISIREAKNLLHKLVENGDNRMSGFIHSSPGIGKSAIVKQIAIELGYELVDIRLASIEATDLCGIPYVKKGDQVFSTPEWFPTDPNSKGILFLDELSNASINVQQAAYRLILDREINNGQKLPKGWITLAAGNLQSDRTGVKGIVPALGNRFAVHLNVVASLQDFIIYAMDAKINSKVMGFLQFKPDYLHKFTAGDAAWPSPRTWEFASNLLGCGFSDGEIMSVLSGCLGEGVASEFQSFCKYYDGLPNFDEVMAGKCTYKLPKDDLGLLAAVTSSLLSLLHENHADKKKIKNLQKVMGQLPDESLVLLYKLIAGGDNIEISMNITEYSMDCYTRVEKYI